MNSISEVLTNYESLEEWPYEACASPATKAEVVAKVHGFPFYAKRMRAGLPLTAGPPLSPNLEISRPTREPQQT